MLSNPVKSNGVMFFFRTLYEGAIVTTPVHYIYPLQMMIVDAVVVPLAVSAQISPLVYRAFCVP